MFKYLFLQQTDESVHLNPEKIILKFKLSIHCLKLFTTCIFFENNKI